MKRARKRVGENSAQRLGSSEEEELHRAKLLFYPSPGESSPRESGSGDTID